MFNVCHVEIPADNVERAKKFYGELFGWKMEKYQGPGPEYWLFKTAGGQAGEGIGGGLMQRMMPQQQITVYIEVPSMDEYLEKVKKLGGQVVVPKSPIPEMGYYALCLDPENNGFGLWEVNPSAK